MPFIPANNTIKCVVNQLYLGQKITNNFYVRDAATWTEAEMITLGELICEQWNAHVGPLQSNECQYTSVSLRDMTAETGIGTEVGFPALSGGDRLGGGLPGNVAVACKLISTLSGRNFRGRLFLAALTEDQVTGNELTTVAHAQIETNMRSFVQDINVGLGEIVIASFYDGMSLELNARGETVWTPVPREAAVLTPVTNVVVDHFTDSMRSRLQGRGN